LHAKEALGLYFLFLGFGLPDTAAIGRELKLDDILTDTVLFIYHVE
jgi:hypothetical protein